MELRNLFKTGLFSLFFVNAAAYANPLDLYLYHHQELNRGSMTLKQQNAIHENYFQQWVDHKTPELGKFAQRFYVDDSNATSDNAPVFLYLCGEAACDKKVLDGQIRALAQKYHARLVALEHRYYGKSIPTRTLSTSNLQYLNYENAMQDIVNFIKDTSQSRHWTGKWITFGGSYSGTVSAYFRQKNPQLISGAIASSAPVIPMQTFAGFDEHATKVAGPECADKMREVNREIEASLNDEKRMTQIKEMFKASKITDNLDFLGLVSDVGGVAVQYGYKDTFCSMVRNSKSPMEGYATFTRLMFGALNIDPVSVTPQGAMSEDPADYEKFVGMRQWYYQTCKEFGAWIIASPQSDKSTRSSLIDTEYNQNVCRRLFGINEQPNVDVFYQNYYLPLLNAELATRIYFTNGANDPWSRMSLIEENGNTTNQSLSYFMIEGGSHCDDLRADIATPSVKAAREKMESLVGQWLQ